MTETAFAKLNRQTAGNYRRNRMKFLNLEYEVSEVSLSSAHCIESGRTTDRVWGFGIMFKTIPDAIIGAICLPLP